jgi:hypothetical protein
MKSLELSLRLQREVLGEVRTIVGRGAADGLPAIASVGTLEDNTELMLLQADAILHGMLRNFSQAPRGPHNPLRLENRCGQKEAGEG